MSDDIGNTGVVDGTEETGTVGNHVHEVENSDGTTSEIELSGLKDGNEQIPVRNGAVSPQMHGRRQIFTNETVITDGNVIEVLNKALRIHQQNRTEEIYLEKYMRGVQPILDRVKQFNQEINNKIVVNIANQIVTFKTSEFAGEPIQYISRGNTKGAPEKVAELNSMMLSEGKQSKDMRLAHKMYCTGVGYRLVIHDRDAKADGLFDEAPFEIYIPDPQNTFVVRANDVGKRVVMGVTYVYLDDTENRVRYTVYTDNVTYTIDGTTQNAGRIVDRKRHNFGMVTLIEYPCNADYMGAFEAVLPLLDAYNLAQSNRLDAIENFVQAVMVFEGVNIQREDFLKMKDLGALVVPERMGGSSGGRSVYYLNEQLDQGQTQTLINDMYQTILQIVGMPSQGNANTSDSSNNGAVIMKNGWWNAEARALETEAMWKASETEFLKVVLKICEQTNKLTGLRVSDMEPRFGRRSYEDLLVKTQSFQSLIAAGMPPIQALTFSKLSKDPESDAIVYEAYQEEIATKLDEESVASLITGQNGWRRSNWTRTENTPTEATIEQSGDGR